MAKGAAIKFKSYEESVPALLKAIKLDEELKRHDKIVLKVNLHDKSEKFSQMGFVEEAVKFAVQHKNPGAEVLIAEGSDGHDTLDLFEEHGYNGLAEKYGVGLVDLNRADCVEVVDADFVSNQGIMFPEVLKNSFVISLPFFKKSEGEFSASLANMVGAYPARHYKGFFSKKKNKILGVGKHQVHDIVKCKMPNLALIDAREQGYIIAGSPLDADKQVAKLAGMDWRSVGHLKLVDESLKPKKEMMEMPKLQE